jgi:hypothetical protein
MRPEAAFMVLFGLTQNVRPPFGNQELAAFASKPMRLAGVISSVTAFDPLP